MCVLRSCAAISSSVQSGHLSSGPFPPLLACTFDRGQALWNIIILISTKTSNTARDLEPNPMAWQAPTNLQPSSQAKYFLCPITRAHCFLSWRQCHPMAPCFPQTVFPVLQNFFYEKIKSILSWSTHLCHVYGILNSWQSREHWCNLDRKCDYWKSSAFDHQVYWPSMNAQTSFILDIDLDLTKGCPPYILVDNTIVNSRIQCISQSVSESINNNTFVP